jgi:Manganese containing catalase
VRPNCPFALRTPGNAQGACRANGTGQISRSAVDQFALIGGPASNGAHEGTRKSGYSRTSIFRHDACRAHGRRPITVAFLRALSAGAIALRLGHGTFRACVRHRPQLDFQRDIPVDVLRARGDLRLRNPHYFSERCDVCSQQATGVHRPRGRTEPGLANLLLEQFGGPQGELAAACRYFTQAVSEDDPGRRDMLFDIATEELSHLEIIGSIVAMLNKGAKGQLAKGVEKEAELYRSLTGGGNDSHTTALLYGGGPALTNSAGVPWTAAYIDTIGEPTADLRSNIAAEARAKIVYERLINVTDDPGIKEALGIDDTRNCASKIF